MAEATLKASSSPLYRGFMVDGQLMVRHAVRSLHKPSKGIKPTQLLAHSPDRR